MFSGWIFSPTFSVFRLRSHIILCSCSSAVDNKSASSANLRFVRQSDPESPNRIPTPFLCQLTRSSFNATCSTVLKSKLDSGSPCYVPLCQLVRRQMIQCLVGSPKPALVFLLHTLESSGKVCCTGASRTICTMPDCCCTGAFEQGLPPMFKNCHPTEGAIVDHAREHTLCCHESSAPAPAPNIIDCAQAPVVFAKRVPP